MNIQTTNVGFEPAVPVWLAKPLVWGIVQALEEVLLWEKQV